MRSEENGEAGPRARFKKTCLGKKTIVHPHYAWGRGEIEQSKLVEGNMVTLQKEEKYVEERWTLIREGPYRLWEGNGENKSSPENEDRSFGSPAGI